MTTFTATVTDGRINSGSSMPAAITPGGVNPRTGPSRQPSAQEMDACHDDPSAHDAVRGPPLDLGMPEYQRWLKDSGQKM